MSKKQNTLTKKKKSILSFAAEGHEHRLTSRETDTLAGEGANHTRGPPAYGIERRLRYSDLVALGIVTNRVTLANWIKHSGFPRGQLLGPNYRTWTEAEIQIWLDSRPIETKTTTPRRKHRGRPRKDTQAEHMTA
jgi:predicted DNA-binding transcriptional regulator AlpA